MSTDQPEGTEPSRPGRAPRIGDSRSPVGSTLSIVLAVVAVVAGFLILKTLRDDDDSSGAGDPNDQSDDSAGGSTSINTGVDGVTSTSTRDGTATTVAQREGATIAVANASGEGGTASTMSTALTAAGYEGVGEPGNRGQTQALIEQSIVYYVAGDAQAQAVAATLAGELGVAAPTAMPDTRPVDGAGDTSTATVLVLLGSAQAGEPLAGASATPPQVSGNSTTTTT